MIIRRTIQVILVLALIGITGCKTSGEAPADTSGGAPANTSGKAPANTAEAENTYFSGSGGQEMSLAILVPEGKGLAAGQDYLPTMVQGEMVANFTKYSRIQVLDRQNLDKILDENESGYYAEGSNMAEFGKILPTDYYLSGNINKTASGYAMQIQVADKTSGVTKASYSGTCSIAEFDNFTGIRRASAELLVQMGVKLTDQAKTELAQASGDLQVNAQTALAQGITAQRKGTEVTAASFYYQAAVYDPSLLEAVNRQSVMSANISSGNIGDDVRNDIKWRKDWIDRLTEIEEFFDNYFKNTSPPFGLFYLARLDQGNVNYNTETVSLSFPINLHAFPAWFNLIPLTVLQDVHRGLNATKRTNDWGLASWPRQTVTRLDPFQSRRKDFALVFELVNSGGKVISSQKLNLRGGWSFNLSNFTVYYDENQFHTVTFNAVKANDITDNLTIRVAGVNGAAPETETKSGGLQIGALREFPSSDFEFSRGVLTRYNGNARYAVIPDTIWGDPVTAIGNSAFKQKELFSVVIPHTVTVIGSGAFSGNQLSNVVIPAGVTVIGEEAFSHNQLTNVVIPAGVTVIEREAFSHNQLTDIVIPDGVTAIEREAFSHNQLTKVVIADSVISIGESVFSSNNLKSTSLVETLTITIGANVSIKTHYYIRDGIKYIHHDGFKDGYEKNGKKAGTYQYRWGIFGGGWRIVKLR